MKKKCVVRRRRKWRRMKMGGNVRERQVQEQTRANRIPPLSASCSLRCINIYVWCGYIYLYYLLEARKIKTVSSREHKHYLISKSCRVRSLAMKAKLPFSRLLPFTFLCEPLVGRYQHKHTGHQLAWFVSKMDKFLDYSSSAGCVVRKRKKWITIVAVVGLIEHLYNYDRRVSKSIWNSPLNA